MKLSVHYDTLKQMSDFAGKPYVYLKRNVKPQKQIK